MTALATIEHDPASEAGFTLLELLIAMTLLALLSALLFGGLKFGSQVWAAAEAKTAGTDKIIAVRSLLSQEMARAYPQFLTSDPTDAHVAFDGTAQTMTFLGPDPRQSGAMLRIDVRSIRDRKAVTLRIAGTPELALAGTPVRPLADLPGLASVAFAYFGAE
ncbi:MAG: prepilin-type N-terminal cleavage/methylation domain-containing protein, partial [Alphaproteobacteria bacterium]|nr:prepilin-type N-terminal cleavage/methylation domain-containing protein [Alphaproteobacteria bacterium]